MNEVDYNRLRILLGFVATFTGAFFWSGWPFALMLCGVLYYLGQVAKYIAKMFDL